MNILINIEKTIDMFGYDPNTLKNGSEKLVIWNCSNCEIEMSKKFRQAQKNNFCLNCSNAINAKSNIELKSKKAIEWHKNNQHPLLGIPRTDVIKLSLSISNTGKKHTDESKRKMSVSRKGDKNHFYNKKHTDESRRKMSEIAKKNAKTGKDSHLYGKVYHPKKIKFIKNSVIFYFKSTWELKVAEYLTLNNIDWEYEKKVFEMIIDEKETTYTPDFYITTTNTIIEVKGYWREDAVKKHNKFTEVESGNYLIEIWDMCKLKSMNIL